MGRRTAPLQCPSAQPDMAGAAVIGVVGRGADGARLRYLDQPAPVTEDIIALTAPESPLRVMRIAARCEEARCTHFAGQRCTLATRIVEALAPSRNGRAPARSAPGAAGSPSMEWRPPGDARRW